MMQMLGSQRFWQQQVLREVGGYGGRKHGALEGYGNQYWPIRSSILAWRTPSLTEKPGRPQSTGMQRVRHDRSDPVCIHMRLSFAHGSSAPARVALKVVQFLGLRGHWQCQFAGTQTASAAGVMALSESFFQPLVAGVRRPLWPVFLCSSAHSGT